MSFEQKIQQWVSVDNQIRVLNEKMKELRDKKNNLNNELTNYAKENSLENSTIQISDGKLKFAHTKIQSSLTFKYLEKSLNEIIKNESQAQKIINYIKNNRETKYVPEIKRFTND